jgi:aspartyl-tRNA synthetase
MMRTHRCGDLRTEHIAEKVSVCGWVASRRDHGGLVFVDLRDAAGVVQVVVDPDASDGDNPHQLRNEYVIRVDGEVRARPEDTVNPKLATGEVEVVATRLEVLNASEPSPIPLERVEADEVLRLQFRYLDLRRDRMQRNLRLRAAVNAAMRASMVDQGFVEIETPALVASTPEGARDFVVPSRLQPGSFYALPQSPQLFKQLLMVGGLDRYFQIARCLRDEDARADRQFEFMQYDMEMSFADAGDVMAVVTEAVQSAVEAVRGKRAPDFARMTWQESMDRFGVDKPDTRFGLELVDVSECFEATEFRAFQGVEAIRGVRVPEEGELGRGRLEALTDRAKQLGAAGLVWMRVQEHGALDSPVTKFLSEGEQLCVIDALGAADGDLLLLVAGDWRVATGVLGQLRLDLARPPVTEGGLQFVWVVDFPLFEGIADDGTPIPAHHPFTMPHPDDLELLATATGVELLGVRSLSYDLVVNGWELGSGSVRIHSPEIQQQVFSLLGITSDKARARFGFLLDAFRYGAPPHAGFALGTDRFAAVLAGEDNIREVIAFPKTQSGVDPLTRAPTPLDPAQLAELGLQVRWRS